MKNIKTKMNNLLKKYKWVEFTAADIEGERVMLREAEVRALQVLCKRAAEDGDFEEFTSQVTVYTSIEAKRVNRFRKDGKFVDTFEGGFYSACSEMVFDIL